MSNVFNRSTFMKERHMIAKRERDYFKSNFGDGRFKYSDFLSNKSPLIEKTIVYEVSYQVSYRGQRDDLVSEPKTFYVLGFKGQESNIQRRTMDMVTDAKGQKTEHHLAKGTISAIERSTIVKIKPRGMEESQKKPTVYELNQLIDKQILVKELDSKIKIKNRKGREGTLNLDIRHFI